jgi:hypothetical protein
VSIGARGFARHETFLIVGLQLAHPVSGALLCRMASLRSQGGSHTGEHIKNTVVDALGEAPLRLGKRRLRAGAVVIGGDGAMCIGGEDHRHQSTGACEKFYRCIFPATATGEELTHWDLFHRDETGAKWAMKDVPLGIEVLEISQIVMQLFGVGSGRVLFRGVAEFLRDGGPDSFSATGKEAPRPLRCSEGHASTRPLAYGHRTTEALYRNYRLVHLGLEARSAISRGAGDVEKKTSQSIKKMVECARRVAALDFVVFLLVYRDVNARILRPFAGATQEVAAEAIEQKLRCNAVTSELRRGGKMLEEARRHLFVMVLVTNYVGPEDIKNYWESQRYNNYGKMFPSFVSHVGEVLWQQRFQACGLVHFPTPAEADGNHMLLHPRCQCGTMLERPRLRHTAPCNVRSPCTCLLPKCTCPPRTMVSHEPTSSRRMLMKLRVMRNGTRRSRGIHVPQWTAEKTPGVSDHTDKALLDIPPRLVLRPLEREPPYYLQGVQRFVASAEASRCRCNAASLLGRYLSVTAALQEGARFLQNLADMLDEYLGPRGSNKTMRALTSALVLCWDWDALRHQSPTKAVLEALLVAYRILRPRLEFTYWPDPGRFPHVEHRWPTEHQMLVQFLLLHKRVVARLARPSAQREFVKPASALVRRVSPPGSTVFRALWPFLRTKPPRRSGHLRILVLIDSFLYPQQAARKEELLKVGVDALYVPGPMRHRRGAARYARPRFIYPGHVLGLLTSGWEGTLVRVLTVTQKVDRRRLAASFDTDPTWHKPHKTPHQTLGVRHCYHVLFLGHRFRFLLPPETCIEGWGSMLHNLYADNANLGPARHAARLFLKESKVQCVGGERDEAIVTAVAEALVDLGGKEPHLRRSGGDPSQSNLVQRLRRDESAWGLADDVALSLGLDAQELKRRTQPTDLDPALRRHLEARVERNIYGKATRDGSGVKLLRSPAIAKPLLSDVTRSVFRERLTSWLSTPEAAAWREQRNALDHPDEEAPSNQENIAVAASVHFSQKQCLH